MSNGIEARIGLAGERLTVGSGASAQKRETRLNDSVGSGFPDWFSCEAIE